MSIVIYLVSKATSVGEITNEASSSLSFFFSLIIFFMNKTALTSLSMNNHSHLVAHLSRSRYLLGSSDSGI